MTNAIWLATFWKKKNCQSRMTQNHQAFTLFLRGWHISYIKKKLKHHVECIGGSGKDRKTNIQELFLNSNITESKYLALKFCWDVIKYQCETIHLVLNFFLLYYKTKKNSPYGLEEDSGKYVKNKLYLIYFTYYLIYGKKNPI